MPLRILDHGLLTFESQAVPRIGHDEQLVTVFSVLRLAREDAALIGMVPVLLGFSKANSVVNAQMGTHASRCPSLQH